jgi:D-tyrosyl-tRNA(Tyr) deacylase
MPALAERKVDHSMKALLQRVSCASVTIEGAVVAQIDHGMLALIGIDRGDTPAVAQRMLQKMLNYRIFADQDGRMNLSLRDVAGGLLLVSQFTLAADTRKGLRPGFSTAAPPAEGEACFRCLADLARQQWHLVETGVFGADMQVMLINDGPVTFLLSSAQE